MVIGQGSSLRPTDFIRILNPASSVGPKPDPNSSLWKTGAKFKPTENRITIQAHGKLDHNPQSLKIRIQDFAPCTMLSRAVQTLT